MRHALRFTLLAGAFAWSLAFTQIATGGSGLPEESGGSSTRGEGSHGTGVHDGDTTRGTKGTNEHLRRNQSDKQKRQMGNPVQSAPDQPRGSTGGESD